MRKCHKKTQRNSNTDARKLISYAVRLKAVLPTDVGIFVQNPPICSVRTQTKSQKTAVRKNCTQTATAKKCADTQDPRLERDRCRINGWSLLQFTIVFFF